jgi:hypothetical protein
MITYDLEIHIETGRVVSGLNAPFVSMLPPLTVGTTPNFRVRLLSGPINERRRVSTDGKSITLSIATIDPKPLSGSVTLTQGPNSTGPIAAVSSPSEVVEAIMGTGIFDGNFVVRGFSGDWTITAGAVGEQDDLTAAFAGTSVSASVSLQQLDSGSSTTKAAYRIQIIEAPPQIVPSDWDDDDTDPVNTVTVIREGGDGVTQLIKLAPDLRAESGFWFVTINGIESPALEPGISAADLRERLRSIINDPNDLNIQADPQGGYIVSLSGSLVLTDPPTVTIDGDSLILPPGLVSTLALTGEAFFQMLAGRESNEARIEVSVAEGGSPSFSSISPVVLRYPVNRSTSTP